MAIFAVICDVLSRCLDRIQDFCGRVLITKRKMSSSVIMRIKLSKEELSLINLTIAVDENLE